MVFSDKYWLFHNIDELPMAQIEREYIFAMYLGQVREKMWLKIQKNLRKPIFRSCPGLRLKCNQHSEQ